MPTVRIADDIGMNHVLDVARRFGEEKAIAIEAELLGDRGARAVGADHVHLVPVGRRRQGPPLERLVDLLPGRARLAEGAGPAVVVPLGLAVLAVIAVVLPMIALAWQWNGLKHRRPGLARVVAIAIGVGLAGWLI